MNPLIRSEASPGPDALRQLDGRSVLVLSQRDGHNPPTAMRGWLEVHEGADRGPEAHVVVDFPQMFTSLAHRRDIPLDQAGVMRLLESEENGTFSFTIDDELA